MTGKENDYSCADKSSQSQVKSSRPSIFQTLAAVKEQVEFWAFARTFRNARGEERTTTEPIYEELCLIIAEVLVMNPDLQIKVAGAELSASIVQEVFGSIRNQHIEAVVHNFQRVSYAINHKKTYLRTALYNAVFESDSSTINDLASIMPGFFDRGGDGK